MNLRSLQHVVVLAKELSYTKAARELSLTQSALTRSIQAMEKQARVRLFDRDRGGVRLTPTGRAFAERASELLRSAGDLEKMLYQSAAAEVGCAAFGMGPLVAHALLPHVLAQTFGTKPELRTQAIVRNVANLLPALLQEEIEFFIAPEDPIPAAAPVTGVIVGSFPISLLVRAQHPVFKNRPRAGQPNYPLLSAGQFHKIDRWPRYCQPYLSGPLHLIEDYGVALRITESTDAVWLCSTFAAREEIQSGRLREIEPPAGQRALRFALKLYSLERRSLSPAAQLLKGLIEEQIRGLSRVL